MKKLKKFIILFLILILVFTIYILNIDRKIYYVALGDSLAAGQNPYNQIGYGYSDYVNNYLQENELLQHYTKDFAESGYRITDIEKDINENKKITINGEEQGIKEVLRKADLLTLSIGANDIFYKLGITNVSNIDLNEITSLNSYINETLKDLDKLVTDIQKYFKKDMILVGYYNPLAATSSEYCRELEPLFTQVNMGMKKIAQKHNIHFVEIYEIFKENPEYLPNPNDIHPSNSGYQVIASSIIDIIEQNIIK